jgi:hypothetical protein
MKILRLRFKVRTLLIAVAVFASALGAAIEIWRRSASFVRLADFHHVAAHVLSEAGGSGCMDNGTNDELYDPILRKAYLYHHNLGRAYSRAARRPWLPVPPEANPAWAYPPDLVEALDAIYDPD